MVIKKSFRSEVILTDVINKETYLPLFYKKKKDDGKIVKKFHQTCCQFYGCEKIIDMSSKNLNKENKSFYCEECISHVDVKADVKDDVKDDVKETTTVSYRKGFEFKKDNLIPFNKDFVTAMKKYI